MVIIYINYYNKYINSFREIYMCLNVLIDLAQTKFSNQKAKHLRSVQTVLCVDRLTMRNLATTVWTAASIFSVTSSAVMPEWPTRAMLQYGRTTRDSAGVKDVRV